MRTDIPPAHSAWQNWQTMDDEHADHPAATDATEGRSVPPAPQLWTTPQVAEFMGISRQAINKRLRSHRLLGYPGKGVTLFPVWQFDPKTRWSRPEVEKFLAAFEGDVDPHDLAQWSETPIPGNGSTPAQLLTDADAEVEVLDLVDRYYAADTDHTASTDATTTPRWAKAEWRPEDSGSSGPRHAILLAAADLFARRGPAKVTLREVAAAADVSYSLIHRFFKSKENLLVAVMELLVTYGGERLSDENDAYAAIENSFGADSGQIGRMLTWSILEGTTPEHLFSGGIRSRGYRTQIEAQWAKPFAPHTRSDFDSRTLAALIALIAAVWDFYEPHLTVLGDLDRDPDDLRNEIVDMLKVLVYATRPKK
ncbi:helix-turn-helix domain-containing protein [Rhodococcus sovatensis]|uniref:Helix-turn-helix domain-containing protein n=1 Tax=Rhodococcus sovatensis TaxID=1805840 RepID=A0ABZ2PLU5_9NOCA